MICDNCCSPSKCIIYYENAHICNECMTSMSSVCNICSLVCGNTCLDIFTRSLQIF